MPAEYAHDELADAVKRILRGTDRERNLALWRVCLEVCRDLEKFYMPVHAPSPRSEFDVELDELRTRLQANPEFARAFGSYRDLVLEHEGIHARRLEVLRSTAVTLLRLRDLAESAEHVDRMLEKLGSFVHHAWGFDLDLSPNRRDWGLWRARRYDLLSPRAREL
jgi:hypothetical protein